MKTIQIELSDENYEKLIFCATEFGKCEPQVFIKYLFNNFLHSPISKEIVIKMRKKIGNLPL